MRTTSVSRLGCLLVLHRFAGLAVTICRRKGGDMRIDDEKGNSLAGFSLFEIPGNIQDGDPVIALHQ